MGQILKKTNILSYSLMIIGVILLLIHEVMGKEEQFVLMGGLVFLVIGIYTLSKKLSPKGDDYKEPLVRSEEIKEKDGK